MKAFACPVLCLLIAAFSAAAQSNPTQTPPPQTAAPLGETSEEKLKQQAKLQGQVLNQVTGEPVRKANLTLKPEGGGTNLKATTDNEGKFTIENIDPGRYTLAGERQGFVTQNYGASRPTGPGTPLDLKKAQVMKDVAFKLTPQGIIAGHILDDDGEPVSGVSVQVLQYRYMMGKKRLIPAVSILVMTNDLGEFRAPNLAPGRYYVATTPQKLTDIQSGSERSAAKTDEALIPTFYPNAADAATASPVNVGPGAEVRGIDLRLRKARVFRVSGKVMNATTGTPLNPAMIMVYRREAGGMSTFPSSMYMVQSDKGIFELRNLPPGPYSLLAVSTNPQDIMVQMTSLDVTEQDIEGMVISVGGGFEIPVTAKLDGVQAQLDQDTSNDPNKPKLPDPSTDLSKIRIVLTLEDNPMASLATTLLDKDGKGLIKRVNADKYKLVLAGLPEGTYLKSAKYGDHDALESGMDLRQGAAGSIDLVIGSPAAQLIGVVHNEKGEPVAGAIVTLVPKDAKGRGDLSRTGSSDQNGNVRMRGIVPAEYNVFAWEDIESGAADDDEFRKPFDSKGIKVKLSEGSKDNVQLTVITRAQVEEEKAKR
jgi:hypothetical protein